MLRGRLGLETARIPHADRHGLLWLSRGALTVRDGTLRFERQGPPGDGTALESGEYGIPFQSLSMILLGPGSTVSHDALRLMARHGTALVAVGEDGVRCYTAPPLMPDASDVARRQMRAWGDPTGSRITIARKMYALRLGEVLPQQEISALRGVEGARMRQTYRLVAQSTALTGGGGATTAPTRFGLTCPTSNQPRLGGRDLGGGGGGHGHGSHSPVGIHPREQRRSLRLGHRRPVPGHHPAAGGVSIGPGGHGPTPP